MSAAPKRKSRPCECGSDVKLGGERSLPRYPDLECPAICPTDDPIVSLMPGISPAEYRLRKQIRSVFNIMAVKIHELPLGHAMELAWIAIETATRWLFAPADVEKLTTVAEQCRRLMIVADAAADLERRLHG